MVISISVRLIGHIPALHFRAERHEALIWVLDHAEEIEELALDCGVNMWEWTAEEGWLQYPQLSYVPGYGVVRRQKKVIRHGNGYMATNPWTFSEKTVPFPNPLCAMQPLFF